jgi:predicted O-methyltransferase YrrM
VARPPLTTEQLEALEVATGLPGYFPAGRLRVLAQMAAAGLLECEGPLLEFGSYCGRSTVVLGALARTRGQELVTVDTHLGSIEMLPPFPYLDERAVDRVHGRLDSLMPLMDSLELAGLRGSVTVLVGRTQALRSLLAPGFAIVFIDGGHDLATATSDVETALALASPAGRIILDDIFTDPRAGGQAPRIAMELALARGWRIVDEEGPLVALAR